MTKFPTSQRATLEFLSSLKVQLFPNPSSGETKITFRLFNNDHTWNLDNLNLALGLHGGGSRMTPIRWDVDDLWRILTGEGTYDSKRSSITSVRHPALRYTLKLFSNTILGRQEGIRVRKDDLYMLHHMLHVEPIDIGSFFIQQLQHVANNNTNGGKIVQGGLITRIATYLGYNEELKRDGFVDGIDADINNWSFTHSSLRNQAPLLPEPPVPSSPLEGARVSPMSVEQALTKLQQSVDQIKAEQKEIKDHLASLSKAFTDFGVWLRSQGFQNPPLPPQ
uniref:Arabidopsis retrotransposon Orf1 C-terminal domain-containing protein n=1 Tax=Chenopodium quinoa TaxID=63459 RepID=A0A803M1U8_CHEQI